MITVRLGTRSYEIVVADSYRALPARLTALQFPRQGWIVTHGSILRRFGRQLLGPLEQAGFRYEAIAVPESEASKSLGAVARVAKRMASQRAMRVPGLLAFGGGVVGDLTGFVAAVYRRGVPYAQLPTTLLAQVDSAIGGKTGVDAAQGKNLLGAFHQPRLVWSHTGLLKSLPMRQRRSGLAEVIKYGVIADPALFAYVEQHVAACLAVEPRAVRVMVDRSCRIKARVVSRDERETGALRATLNFGHTLGHALEAATAYRRWTHGEAIAIGMCAAAALGVAWGRLSPAAHARIVRLIERSGLPTRATRVSPQRVWSALSQDKKFIRGRMRWVIPQAIGKVLVTEALPPELVRGVVSRHLGGAR